MVRNPKRTEAGIQADVRQFILSAPFELEPGDLNDVSLESPVGDRRRIDVEAGSTVIEVKRDLRKEKSKRDAEKQLAGYVEFRMQQTGLRYVGVLTTVRNRFVEAGRLDALEAPQRAIDVRKRQEAEDRLVFDKARSANLPNFCP